MAKAGSKDPGRTSGTFRKVLLNKKAELLIALGINYKRLVDSERESEEDQARVSQDEFVRLRLSQVLYGQLRQVDSALDRMDLGEYGSCVDCGSLVPLKRLQAVPWARYCLDCQERASSTFPYEAVSLGGGCS